jgi:hypothetical protein
MKAAMPSRFLIIYVGALFLIACNAISRPTSDEADRLRSLIAFLKTIIEGHTEIQHLPRLIEACA